METTEYYNCIFINFININNESINNYKLIVRLIKKIRLYKNIKQM